MFEKSKITKDGITKIIISLIIASIVLLSLSILTDDNDSRKQISNGDQSTEATLCSILSEIKGVGDVNVMLQHNDKSKVTGVIVTAQGVQDPVVKSDILKGVSTLFDIPVSNVIVFEKKQEESKK